MLGWGIKVILKIEDQRSPKNQDQLEINLDHPKDQDHQCSGDLKDQDQRS